MESGFEKRLKENLKHDKHEICVIPVLDPFDKRMIVKSNKTEQVITCGGRDWARCYFSDCAVQKDIFKDYSNVTCTYRDIVYKDDKKYDFGNPFEVHGEGVYRLQGSDQVEVYCTGIHKDNMTNHLWSGHLAGIRYTNYMKDPDKINIIVIAFDSLAKNEFIRKMPASYDTLINDLDAVVMHGYNVLESGSAAALFPLLTGKTEYEMANYRKSLSRTNRIDASQLLFQKFKMNGYRTAFFDSFYSDWSGPFTYRHNGFGGPPADHYIRSYLQEAHKLRQKSNRNCIGDTPQYKVVLNLTTQFMASKGNRFGIVFLSDFKHEKSKYLAGADNDFALFLENYGMHAEDTMLIVMSDHGERVRRHPMMQRDTDQGKLEERLPLLAIVLPDRLKDNRPLVVEYLSANMYRLTTVHDIYATILDVADMKQYSNDYKVPGSDLTRGLSILENVPINRSCSEAGIEPHWCACTNWYPVPDYHQMYMEAALAFLNFINMMTKPFRDRCQLRNIVSVKYVRRQFKILSERNSTASQVKYLPNKENFQIKITVGPGETTYEATMVYFTHEDKFVFNTREISKIYDYKNKPGCISHIYSRIFLFCYCIQKNKNVTHIQKNK